MRSWVVMLIKTSLKTFCSKLESFHVGCRELVRTNALWRVVDFGKTLVNQILRILKMFNTNCYREIKCTIANEFFEIKIIQNTTYL